MSQLDEYSELLNEKGVPLLALGLDDVALDRYAALQAVDLLRASSRSILGGDVFFEKEGKLEVAYANWHTDKDVAGASADHVNRSCDESRNYIESFPNRSGATPLFVIVVSKKEDTLP